ncbi:hypothetical protein U1Q18_004185 [Sarracenia purpurea var. burkii]
MERESLENGQITRCLLAEDKPGADLATGDANEAEIESPAVTAVVVLSTFVAVSGSFAYGFAAVVTDATITHDRLAEWLILITAAF